MNAMNATPTVSAWHISCFAEVEVEPNTMVETEIPTLNAKFLRVLSVWVIRPVVWAAGVVVTATKGIFGRATSAKSPRQLKREEKQRRKELRRQMSSRRST
jgi:hypothetical protein